MKHDVKNQSTDGERDEQLVEQCRVIYERRLVGTWLIMGQPGVRKILRRIGVAFPAIIEQVLFEDRRVVSRDLCDVVHSMTIRADRFPRGHLHIFLTLVKRSAHSMEVLQISFQDSASKAILFHQFFVAMALSAHIRAVCQKVGGTRILNIMRAMTIGANGRIRILTNQQSIAMHTLAVRLIHAFVTASAGLRNHHFCDIRLMDVVRSMTINADGRSGIPF